MRHNRRGVLYPRPPERLGHDVADPVRLCIEHAPRVETVPGVLGVDLGQIQELGRLDVYPLPGQIVAPQHLRLLCRVEASRSVGGQLDTHDLGRPVLGVAVRLEREVNLAVALRNRRVDDAEVGELGDRRIEVRPGTFEAFFPGEADANLARLIGRGIDRDDFIGDVVQLGRPELRRGHDLYPFGYGAGFDDDAGLVPCLPVV